ncbi:MAG: hypothetical protein AABY64_03650 [Bdellovibrionota bacterium]
MQAKYLMLAISFYKLLSKEFILNPPIEYIKKTIRNEIHSVLFKLLVGVVLTSTIIFSIFHLANAIHNLLIPYQYGLAIEAALFGGLVILGLGALYSIFKTDEIIKDSLESNIGLPLLNEAFFKNVMQRFAEGFMEGAESSQVAIKKSDEQTEMNLQQS